MQTTDTATQATSSPEAQVPEVQVPEAQAVESAQAHPDLKDDDRQDDRSRPPLLPRSSEMPYAIRLLAITSTVGMSTILLGQGLWQPDTNAARLPVPEDSGVNRQTQPSLRDRVSVTTLKSSAMSPPETLPVFPIHATPQNQLKPPAELPTVRISHGFDNAGKQAPAAAPPLPTLPVPTVPIPTSPVPQTPSPIAMEPQAASVPKQLPKQQAERLPAVIASLLERPKPQAVEPQTADTGAIVPRPNASTKQMDSERNPSQAALSQAVLTVRRAASEQPDPTALSIPAAASMQIAAAARLTAIEQPSAPLESISIKPLTITGNTRFSTKALVDVVQTAIATNGERSAYGQPMVNRISQADLQQASEAITQFYAAHGYTNVAVDVSTAMPNGATPGIRILEDTLEDSNPLLSH